MNFMDTKLTEFLTFWLNRQWTAPSSSMCDFDSLQNEIQLCDIILVEGRSRISEVVKTVSRSCWSHAAIYLGRKEDIQNGTIDREINDHNALKKTSGVILETNIEDGTVLRPLEVYRGEHLRICRPRKITSNQRKLVINHLTSALGQDYGVRQLFDLARFMVPWSVVSRRWHSTLFSNSVGRQTNYVCSTLISTAFSYASFPILPLIKLQKDNDYKVYRRNPKLCTPADFDKSPYFDIVKYPYMLDAKQNEDQINWDSVDELEINERELYV